MKTRIILTAILFFAVLFPAFIQAQYNLYPGQNILFPGNYTIPFHEGRPQVDKITCKPYDAEGNYMGASSPWHQSVEYKWLHSEDGKRDTVYVLSGVIFVSVYDYYDNEKIKSIQDGYPHPNGEFEVREEETFEYDQEGRLILHNTIYHRLTPNDKKIIQYDYTRNTITETKRDDTGETVTITSISFTDKGYIAETNGEKTEYIFDEYNRPVKAGDILYEYFDGGYSRIDYSNSTSPRIDYFYDNKGYLSKAIYYIISGDEWVHDCTYLYTYEPDHTVSNIVAEKKTKVYTYQGKVVIESDKLDIVSIYSSSGRLVEKIKLSSSKQEVNLNPGFYIINIGSETHKVFIR